MQTNANKIFIPYSMKAGQLSAVKNSINVENKQCYLLKYIALIFGFFIML